MYYGKITIAYPFGLKIDFYILKFLSYNIVDIIKGVLNLPTCLNLHHVTAF